MEELSLPPLLNAICCSAPFETAIARVRRRKAGAGDFFWSPDYQTGQIAIVLEPDVNRTRVLEMLPLAMVALSDCLAVLLPPQVSVRFRNEKQLVINDGVAGEIGAAIANVGEEDIPQWLVVAVTIGLTRRDGDIEPGQQPDITTLDEEGWEEMSRNKFVETYARHFLSWLAAWNDDGFKTVARAWRFKSEDEREPDMTKFAQTADFYESSV